MLVDEGHAVTLVARGEKRLWEAANDLGGDVHPIPADISDRSEIARVVAAHRARYGRLDVLVNNAGLGIQSSLQKITTEDLDAQLAVDLRSVVLFCSDCVELLRAAGAEHRNALIVNVASIFGKRGMAGVSVYSAAKAGVVAFTESLNKELFDAGVKSTALCPALVDTPMVAGVKRSLDARALILPGDIAEAVRYLLRTSPECVVPEILFTSPGDSLWPDRGAAAS